MKDLPVSQDPNLLVGLDVADDAGVYKLNDEVAIIQTVDFFTPIVDDPFLFGQIAAVNSMSDVYAMGGKPLTVMNIVGFPLKALSGDILKKILLGGISKIKEAGALLVGGHSVEDSEVKYGLSVTGVVHPDRVVTKGGAKTGDKLILTKPLGTGIISTAIKASMASQNAIDEICISMISLNKSACEIMMEIGVNACTDITGFGLVGHLMEMLDAGNRGAIIYSREVPLFSEALEYAGMGLVPEGTYRNKSYYSSKVEMKKDVDKFLPDVLYDAQTSGGLLIALPDEKARLFVEKFGGGKIIGEITEKNSEKIVFID